MPGLRTSEDAGEATEWPDESNASRSLRISSKCCLKLPIKAIFNAPPAYDVLRNHTAGLAMAQEAGFGSFEERVSDGKSHAGVISDRLQCILNAARPKPRR